MRSLPRLLLPLIGRGFPRGNRPETFFAWEPKVDVPIDSKFPLATQGALDGDSHAYVGGNKVHGN